MTTLGIKDINGVEIQTDHTIQVRVKTWNGYIEICRGPVKFIGDDISSWGCGYAVVDPARGTTFLSSISRSSTEIEVVQEENQLTLF